MRHSFALTRVLFALTGFYSLAAHAQGAIPGLPPDIVAGQCSGDSHTAEGPLGVDLTDRHVRFFCDAAVIKSFDHGFHHVMVQFSESKAEHSPVLGFAGFMRPDGKRLDVQNAYFEPGKATAIDDGYCTFHFTGHAMTSIFCGAKVDESGRRTVAIVSFSPGVEP